jgi:hypothetical protein
MKTRTAIKVTPATFVLALVCACAGTRSEIRPSEMNAPTSSSEAMAPVAYARDGSVVVGDEPGSITTTGEPTRDVASHAGSRMYLLDLYQKAMDEKDALSLEVKGLGSALSQEQGALEAMTKERDALAAKLQQMQGDNERFAAENADLAARLTTAQIRRLEAEKLLLEAQIEWQRAQAAESDALRKGRSPASAQRSPAATGAQSATNSQPATNSHPLKRAAEEASSTSKSSTDAHTSGDKP